ncbi:hypothetical protein C2S53_000261 [Perilla frutescens var. hirtella]|uniref:Pyrrolo-quinoline quinone repeat domain-containing protein n=1 Tax=Perilla frutescens var. hirtella TaxID=608512 RepID=A0AAD4P928_PERFH|nr:hypothetical protein C2S53_000261 [Perilla frutescens var. hirtella]
MEQHTYKILLISIFCLAQAQQHVISLSPGQEETQNSLSVSGNWVNHGGDIYNNRYAQGETKISRATASRLRLKWKFYAGNDISATPAVCDGILYFPSWNGYLYAVRAGDGTLVWKKNLQKLTGLNSTLITTNATEPISRATPTLAEDKLIIAIYGPAYVVAVKRATGELVWKTQLDNHPASLITMSGTYYARAFYVGVSSLEEVYSIEDCCTFRGSFVKLDITTGAILWRTFMLPDNQGKRGGYSGAALWGSSPSIDVGRAHVYIATGNLYSVPQRVEDCQQKQDNQTVPTHPEQCIEPQIHFDSILALDLSSGKIKWYRQLGGYDVWFLACRDPSTPNCPPGPNPDADFGEAPMMLTINANGSRRDVVVAVQKSGFAWALDRTNGNLLWSTEAGPGGAGGGGIWGAATDSRRVYTNIANSNKENFTLAPSKKVTVGGGWVAMDAGTGKILWSTAVPYNASNNPVTVANGVVFGGSTYGTGPVYAIDATSGEILWSYETGASVFGGFAVSRGCAFVGHGYPYDPVSALPTILNSMEHNHYSHTCKALLFSIFCLLQSAISFSSGPGNWVSHGGDIYNNRHARGENKISPATASRLRIKWKFYTGKDITATPAVCDGIVYFLSWNGYLYAVRAGDGSLVWKKNLQQLTGLNSTTIGSNATAPLLSRTTPAVAEDKLIIGIYGPAYAVALKLETGELLWKTQLDTHPASVITMSGTYYRRAFYVGVSSLEEGSSIDDCCTF